MIGGADRPSDGQKREGLPYFLLPPLPLTVRPPLGHWLREHKNPFFKPHLTQEPGKSKSQSAATKVEAKLETPGTLGKPPV